MTEEKPLILVIDDEIAVRRFLSASIDRDAFRLIEAATGESGLRLVATENPAVILLDLGLPDVDGVEVARRIREWSKTPIIVLSARGQERDKVDALDAGADDYLTKPFGIHELLARIRVALRHRPQTEISSIVEIHNWRIDLAGHTITRAGVEVHLTRIEFKFLALLARNAGKVVTHRQILREVWGPEYETEMHYLRVYAQQLRAKLEDDPAQPKVLVTESGVGYRLRTE